MVRLIRLLAYRISSLLLRALNRGISLTIMDSRCASILPDWCDRTQDRANTVRMHPLHATDDHSDAKIGAAIARSHMVNFRSPATVKAQALTAVAGAMGRAAPSVRGSRHNGFKHLARDCR
jgi:hypothetical protein